MPHTDGAIQKLKRQYNREGGPALQVTLAEVREDLRLRPPQILTLEELELTNGSANGHTEEQLATSGMLPHPLASFLGVD